MAKAKINSGHGRAPRTKTGSPTKPGPTKVRTGFQALGGLNTSGSRQAIPHDSGASRVPQVYGRPTGRKMY